MAKSKLRGGSKAHKSRVSKRNIKQQLIRFSFY